MASAAADAAESGPAETFETFFKDTSQSTRQAVAASFRKVAEECSSTPGGTGKSYCTDEHGTCGGGLLAYTYWQNTYSGSVGSTYYCPVYYSTIPAKGIRCDDQSQASNTLHETTHAVLATRDIAYGLANVKALSGSQALHNADSYTYYAIGMCDGGRPRYVQKTDNMTAIELKCGQSGSGQSYSPVGGGSSTRGRVPWWYS